jgi:hypothetical protein
MLQQLVALGQNQQPELNLNNNNSVSAE